MEAHWKILIVDDTDANIDVLLATLPDEYEISVALDGKSALQSVAEDKPDLILLDVMMPGMTGYQVCAELKLNAETRQIPIIFLTALSEDIDEETGLQLGAVDYITRPFNHELVRLRIHHQLDLKCYQNHLEELVQERTQALRQARDATIASMVTLAGYRDQQTGMHIQRTISFVKILAERLVSCHPVELSPATVELISRSAPLHDIGKIAIPDAILRKSGKLTKREFAVMQQHTLYGADAIRRTEVVLGTNSFLQFAREIAESHHEKWNGAGYPHGLKGEEIPLSARIMALADVYDALTTVRPYKSARTHEESMHIIIQGDDRTQPEHFDPHVLNAFIDAQDEFRYVVESIVEQKSDYLTV